MTPTYTDFLDQPIVAGDKIVFAQAGYGGAELKIAEIHAIIPLVDCQRFM